MTFRSASFRFPALSTSLLRFWALCLAMAVVSSVAHAQRPDRAASSDTAARSAAERLGLPERGGIRLSDPTRAALLSAALPGAGQAYNGTAWKTPIVLGGFAVLGYVIDRQHNNYVEFRNAIFLLNDGDPDTNPTGVLANIPESNLVRGRDFYRRERDFAIILTALWYGLNVAEAAVHAHLKTFDVSDDLSAAIRPKFGFAGSGLVNGGLNGMGSPYLGAGLTITIR